MSSLMAVAAGSAVMTAINEDRLLHQELIRCIAACYSNLCEAHIESLKKDIEKLQDELIQKVLDDIFEENDDGNSATNS